MRRGPRGPAHTLYLACIFNRKNASQLKSWLFLITRLTPIKNLLQRLLIKQLSASWVASIVANGSNDCIV